MNLDKNTKKGRLVSVSIKTLTVVLAGAVYALFVRLTGLGLPCIIKLITKKYCPGCGVSRMFLDILRLDFASAMKHNILLFGLLPFGIALFIYKATVYVNSGKTDMSRWETVLYIIVFVLCVAFWIMRNMPQFSYLAP